MALKRLSEKCMACPKVDTCDHKRMEAVGFFPEPIVTPAVNPSVESLAAPMAVKHSYRDVKIAEGVTVTVDLEEIKRNMEREFYRGMLPGLM